MRAERSETYFFKTMMAYLIISDGKMMVKKEWISIKHIKRMLPYMKQQAELKSTD